MSDFEPLAELCAEMSQLEAQGLARTQQTVDSPCGPEVRIGETRLVSFCSNDYLGFAADPRLAAAIAEGARLWGAGSGASHLVSGHLRPHADAERKLAAFLGAPSALLYSTGYLANIGVIPALLGRGDALFADRLNHASLIDSALLSRAEHHRFPHRDLDSLEALLARSTARRKLIVVDAVFSMDGDVSDLRGLLNLARRYDAWLMVDDAHGFGVRGPQGRGSLAAEGLGSNERLIYVGTLGKAAGLSGAFVAGDDILIRWLTQRSRTRVFTTASIPALSVAIGSSLELIAAADMRRTRLAALQRRLREGCQGLPWRLLDSDTPIQPLLVGEATAALRLANGLWERGYWVPAIRPPTVPAGASRLRISLSAAHDESHIDGLIESLRDLAETIE